jgi:hypothetical protein
MAPMLIARKAGEAAPTAISGPAADGASAPPVCSVPLQAASNDSPAIAMIACHNFLSVNGFPRL